MRRRQSLLLVWIWIAISTVITMLLSSASIGMERNALNSMLALTGITHIKILSPSTASGNSALSDDTAEQLRTFPNIKLLIPVDALYGEISIGPYVGYSQFVGLGLDDVSLLGYLPSAGNSSLKRGQVVVGSDVPLQLYFRNRPGKQPTEKVDLLGKVVKVILTKYSSDGQSIQRSYPFQVVGILNQTGSDVDYSAYFSIADSERFKKWMVGSGFSRRFNGYDMLIAVVDAPENVEIVHNTIASWGYLPESRLSDTQRVRDTVSSLRTATSIVGTMSIFSCVFGIFLTTLNLIAERKSEIGLMKAVGATNQKVMLVFMGEVGFLGFSGSVLGNIAGLIIQSFLMNWSQKKGSVEGQIVLFGLDLKDISFITPVWLILSTILLITCFSLIGGIIPAMRAAKMDPIDALRDT